jgi:UDP-glucose 4-epimerase
VNELAGNEIGVVYMERRDGDVKHRLLSFIKKAQKLLGFKPKMAFKDGLKKVNGWFVEIRENINRSAEF